MSGFMPLQTEQLIDESAERGGWHRFRRAAFALCSARASVQTGWPTLRQAGATEAGSGSLDVIHTGDLRR